MSPIAEAIPRPQITIHLRAARFLAAILLVSFGPWLLLPVLPWPAHEFSPPALDLINALVLVNVMHVGMTGLFWIDRRYRVHIASRPRWFYLAPAAVTALSIGAVLALGTPGFIMVTAVNTAWLFYHFTKQNWGLLCLASSATRAPRPRQEERHLYVASAIGGTAGVLAPLLAPFWPGAAFARPAGAVVVVTVGLVATVLATRRLLARQHPAHVLMTVFAGFYFAPLYLFNPALGSLVISTGHSLQYMAIMGRIAGDRQQGSQRARVYGMLACGVAVAWIYGTLNYAALWGPWAMVMNVAYLCVSMWHFIVDADVWRLSQPFQRQALRESIPYLFARP